MISLTLLPGLYVGCSSLDALMQSTLECFYQYQCLSQLFNRTDIKPLNGSIKSSYDIHTKFKVLIEKLFIEQRSSQKDFKSFYQECQPNRCSYSYNTRGNVAFIITTILSLVGGLFVALKATARLITSFYETIARKVTKSFCISHESK